MSIFPTKILLATDGSEEAELASRTAAELAQSTSSELHLLYVGEAPNPYLLYVGEAPNPYVEEVELAGDDRQARTVLDAEAEKVRAVGATVAQAHLSMGKAGHQIVALAEEIGAGLIVMGSKGRGGMRRALMGSVSESVVRHAHCPVLVVRE